MCFSATASFSAGAVLLGIGALTLKMAGTTAGSPREWPFAAIPLLFAIQQLIEGVMLSFGAAYASYARWFISVWCFFAALLSAVICFHFALRNRGSLTSKRAGTRPTTQRSN